MALVLTSFISKLKLLKHRFFVWTTYNSRPLDCVVWLFSLNHSWNVSNYLKVIQGKTVVHNFEWLKKLLLSADLQANPTDISWQKVAVFSHSKLCTTVLILDGQETNENNRLYCNDTSGRLVFVRILGEIKYTKKTFRNYSA